MLETIVTVLFVLFMVVFLVSVGACFHCRDQTVGRPQSELGLQQDPDIQGG